MYLYCYMNIVFLELEHGQRVISLQNFPHNLSITLFNKAEIQVWNEMQVCEFRSAGFIYI